MNTWEIKVLNGETSFLRHLDDLIDQHPLGLTVTLIYLLLLAVGWVIVKATRRRASRRGRTGPCIIYVETPVPPSTTAAEPNPFPPMRDVDDEIERLRDEGYFDD